MTENILIFIFVFLILHYAVFLLKIFTGLNKVFPAESGNLPEEFISVIVPFRNEEKNIQRIYLNLTEQNYPEDKYEIIFVNDSSSDSSLQILESLIRKSNVRVLTLSGDYSRNAHKKRAIRFGIDKSIGRIIVTTDADCLHNRDWLRNILKFMDAETGFVSGPVAFVSGSDLFSRMQKLEFAGLVIAGAGMIGSGRPTICNAANIAYRKEAYEAAGGFSFNMSLSSGDDELLMQKIHRDTNYKIKFALDKKAIVLTEANRTLRDFYQQRKRWASKGLFYSDNLLIVKLVLIFLFYLSLLIQPLLAIFFDPVFIFTFVMSFLVKIVLEYNIIKKGTVLLFSREILKPFLITEILQIPYILTAGFMGIFGNLVWKDRKIKR